MLGNLHADVLGDAAAADDVYRAGIAAGDVHSHNDLGVLLSQRGDLAGAESHFRLGADAGDELAARHLCEIRGDDEGAGH